MKQREVIFAPEAHNDLLRLYDRIANASSPVIAASYFERFREWADGLNLASERGRRRDDIRAGLRVIGFEGRLTVAFEVLEEQVVILRVFYGGRNWETEPF